MEFINITAVDRNSSLKIGRAFSVKDPKELKKSVLEFEKENLSGIRRYELISEDIFEDELSAEVLEVLDELEVTY